MGEGSNESNDYQYLRLSREMLDFVRRQSLCFDEKMANATLDHDASDWRMTSREPERISLSLCCMNFVIPCLFVNTPIIWSRVSDFFF